MVPDSDERSEVPDERSTFPEYSIECLYDDRTDPSEVTLYEPRSDGVATAWITADLEATVSLDSVR